MASLTSIMLWNVGYYIYKIWSRTKTFGSNSNLLMIEKKKWKCSKKKDMRDTAKANLC